MTFYVIRHKQSGLLFPMIRHGSSWSEVKDWKEGQPPFIFKHLYTAKGFLTRYCKGPLDHHFVHDVEQRRDPRHFEIVHCSLEEIKVIR